LKLNVFLIVSRGDINASLSAGAMNAPWELPLPIVTVPAIFRGREGGLSPP
jgi:hypothetical protein